MFSYDAYADNVALSAFARRAAVRRAAIDRYLLATAANFADGQTDGRRTDALTLLRIVYAGSACQ